MIEVDTSKSQCLIWLASYPRSGNTWTRALLNALFHLGIDPSFDQVDLERLGGVGDNSGLYYKRYVAGSVRSAEPRKIAELRKRVQTDIIAMARGVQIVKTHNARIDYLGYPLIEPALSAGAVYVLRNPLDVAISLAHFLGVSIDQAIVIMATRQYREPASEKYVYSVWGGWSENVRSWTERPDGKLLVVRYEDLNRQPKVMAEKIARHVLMDPTPDRLDRAVELASFERLSQAEQAKGFREKPGSAERFFRAGSVGEWRQRLSTAQVGKIVSAHGAEMERFGYLP